MSLGVQLAQWMEQLAGCQALFAKGIACEGQAEPGAGALCCTGQAQRTEDIAGNVTRTVRWRLWLVRPAMAQSQRTQTSELCEALRLELESAALPEDWQQLTAAPVRCEAMGPGGEGSYYMDLELTVTERME